MCLINTDLQSFTRKKKKLFSHSTVPFRFWSWCFRILIFYGTSKPCSLLMVLSADSWRLPALFRHVSGWSFSGPLSVILRLPFKRHGCQTSLTPTAISVSTSSLFCYHQPFKPSSMADWLICSHWQSREKNVISNNMLDLSGFCTPSYIRPW